ncbi:MAG TPA: hypothetical protein VN408_33600 [Actinoplanes sp.]|nr:hypothetical protein [Actinoplanes sp.]
MLYGNPTSIRERNQSWRSAGLVLLAVLVLCGAGALVVSLRIDGPGPVWATGVAPEPSVTTSPTPTPATVPSPSPSATPDPVRSSRTVVVPTSRPVKRSPTASPSRSPSPSTTPIPETARLGDTCSPEGSEARTELGLRVFCRTGLLGGQPRWRLL